MQCQPYREFGFVCENTTDCTPNLKMVCQTYQNVCHCPESQSTELCLCPPERNETVTYCDCPPDTRFIIGKGCCRLQFVYLAFFLLCLIFLNFCLDDVYAFDLNHVCENDYECKFELGLSCNLGVCS